ELNTEEMYFQIPLQFINGSHALIVHQEELLKASTLQLEVEKTKKLPEFSVGYYNQSFREINTNRFQSFMVGVAVPIFQGSNNAAVKSAQTRVSMQVNEMQIQKNTIQNQLEQLQGEGTAYDEVIQAFKTIQTPEATLLQKNIQQQLASGEINFLDWVILNEQIMDLHNQLAEQLFTRNKKAV